MIKLKILLEKTSFSNWIIPSTAQLKQEFNVEHEKKGMHFFKNESDFLEAAKKAKIITVTKSINSQIENRSNTTSFEDLLDLITSYRSYPKYRNEDTLKAMYTAFKENKEMDCPIILQTRTSMRIFSGNTRMDIAFQLGINPKALLIKVK